MTDRELLELAAKAGGMIARGFEGNPNFMDGVLKSWNPLTDDGDALRLAVELEFNVYHAGSSVYAEDLDAGVEIQQGHERNKMAATRRAIVLAAAEIGKSLP